jgi:polyhydroxybutyrate depolymerase
MYKQIMLRLPDAGRFFLVALALGWVSGCAIAASAANRHSAPSGQRQILLHDGIERRYTLHTPRDLSQGNGRVPLVLVLHGGGGNAANAERMTGFSDQSDKGGFIVAYPEGTGRFKDKLLTWNAGHCCGSAMQNHVDDVGFINALIDRLIKDYPVDPKRIYVTGMSNGGMMTHRLGIELSNRFAAIAPVAATLFGDEPRPHYPVSALMLNGMLDKSVPNQGGPPGGHFTGAWDGTPAQPAQAQAVFWADAAGCMKTPEQIDRGSFMLTRYRCPDGKAVEMILVKDNGHAWPGGKKGSRMGDSPSTALNGTDVIWTFFMAHTK